MEIRSPIVTVAGHVDHGKTTILDTIRGSCVAAKEPGMITQKISFTAVPSEIIKERCSNLLAKYKIELEIPGFLFIDTPGHAAFTHLRKRGGSLSDLAILVIDINEGIMEQTRESIAVLKAGKVPFIVALNKVDAISGWHKLGDDLKDSVEKQSSHTTDDFNKKIYRIINAFAALGFDSDIFYRVSDFTKQLALIPCSGKTGEGISELIAMLSGLSQRFLKNKLKLTKEGKGTIVEVKKEKGIVVIEAILYDGTISEKDSIIVVTTEKPIVTKIRALFDALPLGQGFKAAKKINAASGIKMHLPATEEIVPGTPFIVTRETKNDVIENLKESLQKEMQKVLVTGSKGIIAKAESLGSLEALVFLLNKEGILIKKAEIGNIKHSDISLALANAESDPVNAVVVGFNVGLETDISPDERVKIITKNIIYHIIEEIVLWRREKIMEIEREKIGNLTMPCRLIILPHCCFRVCKPAIFGVKVEAGILNAGISLMNSEGEEIDKVRSIQCENKNINKAVKGDEVAISFSKTTYGRQIKENQILYSNLNDSEFLELKKNKKYLSGDEIKVMQEIANIKRKTKPMWGI